MPSPTYGTRRSCPEVDLKSLFQHALAAHQAGNLAAAEAALFKDNVQPSGTIESDVECATRLTHAALVLRERFDYKTANVAAARALALLAAIPSDRFTSAGPERRSQAHEAAGFIYERLLADPGSAKASFTQAQRELPDSKAAKAGLDRIKATEDQVVRQQGGKD